MKLIGDPEKTGRNRLNWQDLNRIHYFLIGMGVILLIACYVREFQFFNLLLHPKPLVFGSLGVGALIGGWLGQRLAKHGEDLTERIQIILFFVVICGLFAPLFGSLANRWLAFGAVTMETVEFVEEKPFYSSWLGFIEGEEITPTAHHLFFYRQGQLKKITLPQPRYATHQRGDQIQLPVKTGLFGASFVVDQ